METSALLSDLAQSPSPLAAVKGGAASERTLISRQHFLNLLTTELANQDPFEPMDNKDFLNQMVQLQSMESSAALTDKLSAMLAQNELVTAGSLIGKRVRGLSESGLRVEGVVESVRLKEGKPLLIVGDTAVPMDRLEEIDNLGATDGPQTTTANP